MPTFRIDHEESRRDAINQRIIQKVKSCIPEEILENTPSECKHITVSDRGWQYHITSKTVDDRVVSETQGMVFGHEMIRFSTDFSPHLSSISAELRFKPDPDDEGLQWRLIAKRTRDAQLQTSSETYVLIPGMNGGYRRVSIDEMLHEDPLFIDSIASYL